MNCVYSVMDNVEVFKTVGSAVSYILLLNW